MYGMEYVYIFIYANALTCVNTHAQTHIHTHIWLCVRDSMD